MPTILRALPGSILGPLSDGPGTLAHFAVIEWEMPIEPEAVPIPAWVRLHLELSAQFAEATPHEASAANRSVLEPAIPRPTPPLVRLAGFLFADGSKRAASPIATRSNATKAIGIFPYIYHRSFCPKKTTGCGAQDADDCNMQTMLAVFYPNRPDLTL
jgi:hypothetical protein